jgi:hypothetical protein
VKGAPNGESWEFYTVLEDSQTFYGEDAGQACCGAGSLAGETASGENAGSAAETAGSAAETAGPSGETASAASCC